MADGDAVLESMATGIETGESDGAAAGIGGPDVGLGRSGSNGDRDRAGTGADVDDAGPMLAEPVKRRCDQPPRAVSSPGPVRLVRKAR
jgi:hypothetical protein